MITISMMDANSFVEGVTLDKVAYKLRFNWSDVAGHWFLDVCDDKNKDIINGLSVVPNFPLLNQYKRIGRLPPGELMAIVTDDGDNIGRQDFVNGRAVLVYMPEEELKNALE